MIDLILTDRVDFAHAIAVHNDLIKKNTVPLQFETALSGAYATWKFANSSETIEAQRICSYSEYSQNNQCYACPPDSITIEANG